MSACSRHPHMMHLPAVVFLNYFHDQHPKQVHCCLKNACTIEVRSNLYKTLRSAITEVLELESTVVLAHAVVNAVSGTVASHSKLLIIRCSRVRKGIPSLAPFTIARMEIVFLRHFVWVSH